MGELRRLTNSTTGGPVFVDVKDGKIIRMTPIVFDDNDGESWTIHARGRSFTPPRRTTLSPHAVAQRSMVYSPKRILTPLKRVDFDHKGKRNSQNRGISGYEPISWDAAADIVAGEIVRAKREAGPGSIMTISGSHHLWGNVGYRFSGYLRFSNLAGMTMVNQNADSWEGWLWGGAHMWGYTHRLGIPEQQDLLEDALTHTDLVVFWSSDPETTGGIYSAFESTSRRFWLKELGVKMVFIDPYFNHTAGLFSDKWFAPRLGTDVPFGLAIAFVWLTEDLYDKDYIADHTTGFGEWKDYVLGTSDGQPKTPEWAEEECGIPAREIRALAREWGSKKTMLAAGGLGGWGGACRSATGNEWARVMIALAAMQGMGKPGSNIWSTTQGAPHDESFFFPGYAEGGISGDVAKTGTSFRLYSRLFPEGAYSGATACVHDTAEGQVIPRLLIPEVLRHERFKWHGKGACGASIEMQFQEFEFPARGYPHIEMYYKYGGSFLGTMTETNRYVEAYQCGKVPFVVNQSIWFEGEARFADIILPACTNFERWDISEFANCSGYIPDTFTQTNHRVITLQHKCIEPLGESKSDYDIFAELAKRLDIHDAYTMGKSEYDWVKDYFHATDLPKNITWEEFEKKGYYVVPFPKDHESTPALRWFAEDRKRDTSDWGPAPCDQVSFKGLQTQSGKIEFVSNSLKRAEKSGVIDPERPVMGPQYIPSWEGHRTTELYDKYPLQMVSPHPRFSFHTMGDSKESWLNEVKDHRVLVDGHRYWIMRVNTADADARGIKDGDLIRAYNHRGSVILCAQVTERLPSGTVHSYESCADYLPIGTPGDSPERAGCINVLTSKRFVTPTSNAQANNSCLIQVEKWEGGAPTLGR
ncbi:MAG: molybdopterin-dependent oxidoreductase [bacterium]